KRIKARGIEVLVYEPLLKKERFFNSEVVRDIDYFRSASDIILANRMVDDLRTVEDKVFTRDLFGND
ncbi:MAG: UDP-glucose 6-dehydrogenase, partial [Pseudomonadota bacterium]|nr:UDP-glucose 6-dehydrogenase [Pseudomonadota bacterium]